MVFGLTYNIVSVELDVKNNSIVQMDYIIGNYQPEGDPQLFIKPYLFKSENEMQELSVVNDIPKHLENGTVIYTKRSRVLLDYTAEYSEEL